ncbi:MAG: ferritin family protein [Spirochaetales bacterium]|nr:ferritin family protein [Spirochaetales bacterium]
MSTGEMKLSDILKFSIKIEHESMLFYQDAVPKASTDEVKTLLGELAAEEVKHESRLAEILDSIEDGAAENFDRSSMDKLIQTSEIVPGASQEDVLKVALQREEHTRDFYSQVSTMTNLAADVVDLFDMLYKQESGHVTRISGLLARL